jgi:hypothetical protein
MSSSHLRPQRDDGSEPIVYRKKYRSGLQFSLAWAIRIALLVSAFIPLILYKLNQEVSPIAVILMTSAGIAGVLYIIAQWSDGEYDQPVAVPTRRRDEP